MRKILVLRGGALGDFIVTLPALARLRQRWPDAWIELVGNATAAQLVLGGPDRLLDAAHSQHEARWQALYGAEPLPVELAAWLASFDLVVNYWPDPEGELRARFPVRKADDTAGVTEQVFLYGAAHPPVFPERPAAAHYLGVILELDSYAIARRGALPKKTSDDGLLTSSATGGRAAEAQQPYYYRLPVARAPVANLVAIHPGSGSARKNWPGGCWRQLCSWLAHERGLRLLVITGEAEPPGLLAEFGEPARDLPLRDLAARLTQCALFIGHDSGVSHLAAACGVPGILLFGPTDPRVWAPPVKEMHILHRGPDVSAIPVALVQDLISGLASGPRPE